MGPGTHFLSVLGDTSVKEQDVRRVVFCSGKHYYALARRRDEMKAKDTAILRLEVESFDKCFLHFSLFIYCPQ